MAQNLNVSKYNDGTAIPNIIDDKQWSNNTTGAYCHYNNDTPSNLKYGKLYNWFVANPTANGNKNVCPTNWHAAWEHEWQYVREYQRISSTSSEQSAEAQHIIRSVFAAFPGGSMASDASGLNNNAWIWSRYKPDWNFQQEWEKKSSICTLIY